jgi:hypothetical protein
MMVNHKWATATAACLILTAANGFAQKVGHPDTKDWKPLFSQALDNVVTEKDVWYWDDNGRLTAKKDKLIWSEAQYENFILDLEYTYGEGANSGVFIYCSDLKDTVPNSLEVQILDDNKHPNAKANEKNGALFGHLAPKVNNAKVAGEWNRMTITAKGQKVHVVVNGEVAVDNADLSKWTSAKTNPDGTDIPPWLSRAKAEIPTKGHIGLQGIHGGAAIYFRNVRVKQL